jgi:hypothetical protein
MPHPRCRAWKMSCGAGAYVDLMQRYPLVTDAFLRLDKSYQKVRSTAMHAMHAAKKILHPSLS